MIRSLLVFTVLSGLAGCSHHATQAGSHDLDVPVDLEVARVDMAEPLDFSFPPRDPTEHPAALRLDNFGGPTIAAVETYTVVWPGDEALGAKVETFVAFLVQSDWWARTLTQYGAAPGVSKGVVVMNKPAPTSLDDDELTALISGMITDGVIPTPNANTLLLFVPPRTLHYTLQGQVGCDVYGGYHSETNLIAGQKISYAVNLQCAGSALDSKIAFDDLTVTISHEAAEAQSDPFPFSDPGWATRTSPLGGENADLCVFENARVTAPGVAAAPATTYLVATVYSQAAAVAGDQVLCQPSATPFFNVAITPADIVVNRTKLIGGTASAKFLPFSFGDVGSITWTLAFSPGSGIKVTPSSGTAKAGDTIPFTVGATSSAKSGGYLMAITVRDAAGDKANYVASIEIN